MGKVALGCLVALVVVVLVLGLAAMATYNRLVGLEEGVQSAWAQVENVYQRRADLIPNLVETVKGARDFEQETLAQVVEARSRVGRVEVSGLPSQQELQRFAAAQDSLSGALSRLLVVVERYPDLKATEAFRDLMSQLEGAENRIAVERRRYNEAARAYNTARRRFPAILLAGFMGFESRPYFEAVEGAETPPTVEF